MNDASEIHILKRLLQSSHDEKIKIKKSSLMLFCSCLLSVFLKTKP